MDKVNSSKKISDLGYLDASNHQEPLKVAYVFQSSGMRLSDDRALQVHMYHIAKGLQQAGHHVTWVVNIPARKVLCTTNIEKARHDKWDEHDLADLGWVNSRLFLLMESAVRKVQSTLHSPYLALFDSLRMYKACCRNLGSYDLIHERYNLMSIGGALASRRMGIPLVLEVNADMLAEYAYLGERVRGLRKIYARWATMFSFRSARRIICVSGDLKTHLVTKWQVPATKISVLPNAADVQTFGKASNAQVHISNLGLIDEPIVMFVGGFYRWHALNLLVESFFRVLQQAPEAKLILVGDGQTRPSIEEKITEFGIADAITITGLVPHEQIPAMLSIADVAVAPFEPFALWKGGSALKVFEYMAAGKAIVATRTGQVAEVLTDGYNGLLVEPGDLHGFANAIVKLLKDPIERARLGQNARQQAVERHSWQHYIKRLEEIYADVLAQKR